MSTARIATGITIAFATSTSFTPTIINHDGAVPGRPIVDTSHQGSGTTRTNCPGKLLDPGTVTLDIEFGLDQYPPMTAAPEQITITFPPVTGESSGGTIIGSGWLRNLRWGAQLEERQEAQVDIVWATAPTITPPS